MKPAILAICIVLVLGAASVAQTPTISPLPNTIFVGADGKFETTPDTALIHSKLPGWRDQPALCFPVRVAPHAHAGLLMLLMSR